MRREVKGSHLFHQLRANIAIMIRLLLSSSLVACLATILSACTSSSHDDFAGQYLEALEEHPGAEADMEAATGRFMAVFENFHDNKLRERVEAAYAPELYFNDTMHTFRDRNTLHAYLQRTAGRIESMEVELLGWSRQSTDLYVRWTMKTRFRILGRESAPRTSGMSHLRLDDAGKIILQQDFWDSSQGFLEHIPVFGGSIRWLRARL